MFKLVYAPNISMELSTFFKIKNRKIALASQQAIKLAIHEMSNNAFHLNLNQSKSVMYYLNIFGDPRPTTRRHLVLETKIFL